MVLLLQPDGVRSCKLFLHLEFIDDVISYFGHKVGIIALRHGILSIPLSKCERERRGKKERGGEGEEEGRRGRGGKGEVERRERLADIFIFRCNVCQVPPKTQTTRFRVPNTKQLQGIYQPT